VKRIFKEKRQRGTIWGFIIDMHSAESSTSWTRWVGTFILTNVMLVWTGACIFDANWKVNFTLEDMPLGLVGIITAVILGKVSQSYVEGKKE
jgi:uncharacterized integral membrane protein